MISLYVTGYARHLVVETSECQRSGRIVQRRGHGLWLGANMYEGPFSVAKGGKHGFTDRPLMYATE